MRLQKENENRSNLTSEGIMKIQNLLSEPQIDESSPVETSSTFLPTDDFIDFYESYGGLALKSSSHECYNPLNSLFIFVKDHYNSFFNQFLFYYMRIKKNVFDDHYREDWRSKHPDGYTKWLAFLDKDSKIVASGEKLAKDRSISMKVSLLPLLQLNDSEAENMHYLKSQIEQVLPCKASIEMHLKFFFLYIWPSRPFFNEEQFINEINEILAYDQETTLPILSFTKRSDLANVASLLIIVRYTSIMIAVLDDGTDNWIQHDSDAIYLKNNPISAKSISVAQLCLSFYKLLKKVTLPILQAMLLLRYYNKDAPEDGDGLQLFRSQNSMGFLAQAALTMGLHRDPKFYRHFHDNPEESNLRRRLWLGLYEADSISTVMSGSLPAVPNKSLSNVDFPVRLTSDPLEQSQIEEYKKSSNLDEIYRNISNMMNNLQTKVSLKSLTRYLEQSRSYVDGYYTITELIPVKDTSSYSSRALMALNLKNSKTITKNLVQLGVEIQIFGIICNHYETNTHLNEQIYKHYFKKQLHAIQKAIDLCSGLLRGNMKNNISCFNKFEINPFISACLFKAASTMLSLILRIFHAQELLKTPMYLTPSRLEPKDLEALITSVCSMCEYALYLMRTHLSINYWTAIKMYGYFNISIDVLFKFKLNSLTSLVDFLKRNSFPSSISENIRNSIKKMFTSCDDWAKIDDDRTKKTSKESSNTIINLKHSNLLVDTTYRELEEYTQALSGEFIFYPQFPSEAFKYFRENSEYKAVPEKPQDLENRETNFKPGNQKIEVPNSSTFHSSDFELGLFNSIEADDDFFNQLLQDLENMGSNGNPGGLFTMKN
ncbi:hypothetical protein WICMUC_003232 [Wickerhamomyces mucosus]|uniref:Transcription factor domain-containing protein n=1 Tax=Wickerhamomyces mucosus TaxID=1378264 RepID=A0A9P8PMT8_9ASCO|nr:hypothetical protein WICMUC_003232 [Wickerhamomyces mucosus]